MLYCAIITICYNNYNLRGPRGWRKNVGAYGACIMTSRRIYTCGGLSVRPAPLLLRRLKFSFIKKKKKKKTIETLRVWMGEHEGIRRLPLPLVTGWRE